MTELLEFENQLEIKKYKEAQTSLASIFLKINSEELENFKRIIDISNKYPNHKIYDQIQNELEKLSDEQIYEILNTGKQNLMSSRLNIKLLQIIFRMGNVKEFEELTEKQFSKFLASKYYNQINKIHNKFKQVLSGRAVMTNIMLFVALELENYDEALRIISEEVQKEETRETASVLKSLYRIVMLHQSNQLKFAKMMLLLKIRCATCNSEIMLSKKEVNEFIILFKDEKFLMYIFPFIERKKELDQYLKNKIKVKHKDIPRYLLEYRDYKEKRIKISKNEIKKNTLIKKEEKEYSELEVKERDKTPISKRDEQSNELYWRVVKEEYGQEELKLFVTSFIENEMYDAAINLSKKLEDNSLKFYFLAEASSKQGQLRECIYYCNWAIDNFENTADQLLSFNYLKYLSFINLGKDAEAIKYKKIIMKENPKYRGIDKK